MKYADRIKKYVGKTGQLKGLADTGFFHFSFFLTQKPHLGGVLYKIKEVGDDYIAIGNNENNIVTIIPLNLLVLYEDS